MKPRRVIVTLEIETESSIALIKEECRRLQFLTDGFTTHPVKVIQVQVNVIRKTDHDKHVAIATRMARQRET